MKGTEKKAPPQLDFQKLNLRTRQGGYLEEIMTTVNTHFGASIECEISKGIGIHVIGVPDADIKYLLLCVCTNLSAIGFHIPGKKIVINIVGMDETNRGWEDLVFYCAVAILKESGNLSL